MLTRQLLVHDVFVLAAWGLDRRYGFHADALVGKGLLQKGSGEKTMHDRNKNSGQWLRICLWILKFENLFIRHL